MSDRETAGAGEGMLGVRHASFALRGLLMLRQLLEPRRIFLVAALAAVVFLAWHLYLSGAFDPARIRHLSASHPVEAVLVFILADAVLGTTCPLCLPWLPLNLAPGHFEVA